MGEPPRGAGFRRERARVTPQPALGATSSLNNRMHQIVARSGDCSLRRTPLPFKKLDTDEAALLKLLHHWRNAAGQDGREIKRIIVAYEAGRDGSDGRARGLIRSPGARASPRCRPPHDCRHYGLKPFLCGLSEPS